MIREVTTPPKSAQGPSHVKKHYINVSVADLIEWEVARNLAAATVFCLKRWRLLVAAPTCERAARNVGTALGRIGDTA